MVQEELLFHALLLHFGGFQNESVKELLAEGGAAEPSLFDSRFRLLVEMGHFALLVAV